MLSRPLVAGPVAGWLAGDVEAGLRVGVRARAVRARRAADRRRALPRLRARHRGRGRARGRRAVGVRPRAERRRGARARVARGLDPAARAAVECARHPAAGRRARGRRERRDPAAAVRRARSGRRARGRAHRARARSPRGASGRWLTLDRGTAVGLTLVAIGAGLAAAANGAVRSAGRGPRLKWLTGGPRRARCSRCWRCSGDRPMARAAPAPRGAGHLELRAHARRRHGLRRRAAARGLQDGRPGPPRRGGRAIGGVLQLQSRTSRGSRSAPRRAPSTRTFPAPQIARLRTALCSPLGALGDELFWAGLVPGARRRGAGRRGAGRRLVGDRRVPGALQPGAARHRRLGAPHRTRCRHARGERHRRLLGAAGRGADRARRGRVRRIRDSAGGRVVPARLRVGRGGGSARRRGHRRGHVAVVRTVAHERALRACSRWGCCSSSAWMGL